MFGVLFCSDVELRISSIHKVPVVSCHSDRHELSVWIFSWLSSDVRWSLDPFNEQTRHRE